MLYFVNPTQTPKQNLLLATLALKLEFQLKDLKVCLRKVLDFYKHSLYIRALLIRIAPTIAKIIPMRINILERVAATSLK